MDIGDVDYEKLMTHIFTVKYDASELVKHYASGVYSPLIQRAADNWGGVPDFSLSNPAVDIERGSATTVLSAIILENYLLYVRHRKLKNLIISIVGIGGSGKTTYAVLSCLGVYRSVGVPPKLALRLVADSIFFDLESFVEGVKRIIMNDMWLPCIIADDIGEWLPKYWRELGLTAVTHFFTMLDQAKDWVGVLIFTARSFKGSLAANLRDKSDYIVDASEQILDLKRLDVFEWYLRQDWSERNTVAKKRRMQYVDAIPASVKMPDEIWEVMRSKRKELAWRSLDILSNVMTAIPAIERELVDKFRRKTLGGGGQP